MTESTPDGEHAPEYDKLAKEYKWFGNEALFGLCFEFISPGQVLLDLGIGTGLGSELFHRAGIKVYGMDLSQEMLDQCEKKKIAVELRKHDLKETPYPYEDGKFDIMISVGVLHFFKGLEPIFAEAERLLKNDGIFAISISHCENDDKDYETSVDSVWNTTFISHSRPYIERLAMKHGFTIQKELTFYGYDGEMKPLVNVAYLLRK